jgi:hypothetical protein
LSGLAKRALPVIPKVESHDSGGEPYFTEVHTDSGEGYAHLVEWSMTVLGRQLLMWAAARKE